MAEGEDDAPALAELFRRLTADAREFALAEAALVRARGLDLVDWIKIPAILFATAALIASAALVALLVGLIQTLAPRVGPGAATLIVVGAALLVAALLGYVGYARLRGARP